MKKRLVAIFLSMCAIVTIGATTALADETEVVVDDVVIEENEEYDATKVAINSTNFPDANFRKYIKTYDKNKDNYLSSTETDPIEILRLTWDGEDDITNIEGYYGTIKSLKGIEYFKNAQVLAFSMDYLTDLDLSKTNIIRVEIESAKSLKSLKLSPKVDSFFIHNTPLLKTLDLSLYPNLCGVYITDSGLTSINLTGCKNLESLFITNNKISSIDLSQCPKLNRLSCENTNIKTLNISKNPYLIKALNAMHIDSEYGYIESEISYNNNGTCKVIPESTHKHQYKDGVCYCGKVANGLAKVGFNYYENEEGYISYFEADEENYTKKGGTWGYYVNGNLQTTKTGIVKKAASTDTKWYFVKNGIYTTASGIAKKADGSSSNWYYVKNGVYTKANGIAKKADGSSATWYYVLNGIYTKSTGITKKADGSDSKWYYVYNGIFTKVTGITKKADSTDTKWYYVKDGVFTQTTAIAPICKSTNGKLYYVKGGLWTQITGKVTVGGKVYKIANGLVA